MKRILLALVSVSASLVSHNLLAVGTSAGTDIANSAQVTYDVSGTPVVQNSNTLTITVAEIIDVNVILQSPTVPVAPGAAAQGLLFTVTNTGNGDETFSLAIDSALAGDQFDPIPSVPNSIFFDTDGSGDLSPGDVPYVPNSNDPPLAADASVNLLLSNDIPGGLNDGDQGFSSLIATSLTGTGAPGDVFGGQGTGGTDAVIGASGGSDSDTGIYIVSNISLSLVKSATVSDPFGGTEPVPGAQIFYQIIVTATGTGTAVSANFNDPIPANATYVAGSIQLNGAPQTDAADADAGQFIGGGTPSVFVSLGDLDQAAGPQTITFTVTID